MAVRRRTLVLGAGALVLLAALAFAGWWVFIRDDAPAPVDIDTATDGLEGEGETASTDGVWSVDIEQGDFADFTSTFVGYRVEEELAGIGANTAVGRTPAV